MKIEVIRTYMKQSYTIGRFYVDGTYMCNTMEPTRRDLSTEAKVTGKTAIPEGTYLVDMSWSSKMRGRRPFIIGVPHFQGVMIHEGNIPSQTAGCILLGENSVRGMLKNSRLYVNKVCRMIEEAEYRGEVVMLQVSITN